MIIERLARRAWDRLRVLLDGAPRDAWSDEALVARAAREASAGRRKMRMAFVPIRTGVSRIGPRRIE